MVLMNKFLQEDKAPMDEKNKFLNEDSPQVNKFVLKESVSETDKKDFAKSLSEGLTHFLIGTPEEGLKQLEKLVNEGKHLFATRSLVEEVGDSDFDKMYRQVKTRVSMDLNQIISKIDKYIP